MKADILSCNLKPGSTFSESKIAEFYDVGRMPLREAIQQLRHEGFVQSIPYKGYIVPEISIGELENCIEFREILEPEVAYLAAERISSSQLEILKRVPTVSFSVGNEISYRKYLEANNKFHLLIAEATGNKKLHKHLADILAELLRFMSATLDLGQEAYLEHDALIQAIANKDKRQAKKNMEEHLKKSRQQILRVWEKYEQRKT